MNSVRQGCRGRSLRWPGEHRTYQKILVHLVLQKEGEIQMLYLNCKKETSGEERVVSDATRINCPDLAKSYTQVRFLGTRKIIVLYSQS